MHEPHGPGAEQIAPHGHSRHDGVKEGEDWDDLRRHGVQAGGELAGRDIRPGVGQQAQQQVQRRQTAQQRRRAPQGPVPGQIFPEEGPVKE